MSAAATPTPEPRGRRTTRLVEALRHHRRLLTITGLSAAVVFLVLTGLDFLHLIHHGGVHISSAVKVSVGLVMVVCVGLVMVLAVADNADEKCAKQNPRLAR